MKTILEELLDYRASELKEGRDPVEITLTADQHRRLKEWCDAASVYTEAPDGSPRYSPCTIYQSGMIAGMRFTPR